MLSQSVRQEKIAPLFSRSRLGRDSFAIIRLLLVQSDAQLDGQSIRPP